MPLNRSERSLEFGNECEWRWRVVRTTDMKSWTSAPTVRGPLLICFITACDALRAPLAADTLRCAYALRKQLRRSTVENTCGSRDPPRALDNSFESDSFRAQASCYTIRYSGEPLLLQRSMTARTHTREPIYSKPRVNQASPSAVLPGFAATASFERITRTMTIS